MQGGEAQVVDALRNGDIAGAGLDEREQRLMEFVALLTQHAYRNTPEEVQKLRDVGWTDEQIAECVYITALFAFFNRVADAFGLPDVWLQQST